MLENKQLRRQWGVGGRRQDRTRLLTLLRQITTLLFCAINEAWVELIKLHIVTPLLPN